MAQPKKIGNRKRFNGFWLGENSRDRIVADWIDEQPNAAETIKALIHSVATGQQMFMQPQTVTIPKEQEEPETIDLTDPRVQALFGALDT